MTESILFIAFVAVAAAAIPSLFLYVRLMDLRDELDNVRGDK